MSELERLAQISDQMESDEQDALNIEPEVEPDELTVEPSEDAAGVAEFVVTTVNGALRLIDNRLNLDKEAEESRTELAPLIEKYEWHRGALGGAFGFKPEISAGFFVGRWLKQVIGQFKLIAAHDKKQKQQHGNKREHQTSQSTHTVSGEERIREVADAITAGADS